MRNRGLSNPWRNTFISLLLLLGGAGSIWAVFPLMDDEGNHAFWITAVYAAGIVACLTGVVALPNFVRGVLEFRSIAEGKAEIARWRVSPDEIEDFRRNDAARSALGPEFDNDYELPRVIPKDGLEVIFVEDGVQIGGTYFPLSAAGMFSFSGVQMLPGNPLMIEFGMVAVSLSGGSAVYVNRDDSLLRIPVARLARAEAVKVLDFFKRVDAREISVKSGRWRWRFIFAFGLMPLSLLAAAYGYWRAFYNDQPDDLALVALVSGVMLFLASAAVAAVLWLLYLQQRPR